MAEEGLRGVAIHVALEDADDVGIIAGKAVEIGDMPGIVGDGRLHVALPDGAHGLTLPRACAVRDEEAEVRHGVTLLAGWRDNGQTPRLGPSFRTHPPPAGPARLPLPPASL